MSLTLYGHPFSSYCWKAEIALYENATPFIYRKVGEDPGAAEDFAALWPLTKMPGLADEGRFISESTSVIEYLDLRYPGPVRFLPKDPLAALETRRLDRIFDNYVMNPMQDIVGDFIRPKDERDPVTVAGAKALLEKSYAYLDGHMAKREWANGEGFSLADCAAAPSLFYADWVHEIPAALAHLRGYRKRLLARPSVKRAVDEARPYRSYFPPGAPDRD